MLRSNKAHLVGLGGVPTGEQARTALLLYTAEQFHLPLFPHKMTPETLSARSVTYRLGTQTIYALIGNTFTLVVGLPLQIYVSRTLGARSLGVYALIDGAVFTAAGFLGFGVAQTAVRFLPEHLANNEYKNLRYLLRLGVIMLSVVGGLAYVGLLLALCILDRFWPTLAAYSHVVAIMGLMLPLGLLTYLLQQGLRGFQEIRYLVFGSSILQLSGKAAATCFAFAIGMSLEGYVLATVFGSLVGVSWMAWGLKHKLEQLPENESNRSAPPLRAWRRYAAICYSTSLLGVASARLDRFMLGAFVDSSAVGVLLVVYQLQQFPQLFNTMLLMVGTPMFAAAHSRDASAEREHLFALTTDWSVKASLPLLLFLALFAHPVLGLFGPGFPDTGTAVLCLLLFGQAFSLAAGPVGSVVMMSGLEHIGLRIDAINTIITVVLTIGLAVPFGLFGVAVATVTSAVFVNLSLMIVARRRLGLRWWNNRYFGWLAPAAVSGGIAVAISHAGVAIGAVSLSVTLIVMYLSFAFVLYIQGLNDDERYLLRNIASRFSSLLKKSFSPRT